MLKKSKKSNINYISLYFYIFENLSKLKYIT